ncbi:E3 ubiquitin-protein ligase TRIM47-like isoform X1 [Acanthochromis polyacanthus]|uniref:E3 ubiquitin-protein ligase TRIM47-like isoform X1 n=1 Tax=Acanthochromis polyacanthus TaxID=80966 RepID=UPI002233E748|nr:E3 ubiquitin-protein ligase TRIM47-like isoform X1 [Acanthochromis polyacanthus]
MAHDQEAFDCSICLQVLEDPVTTACGHSFCMKCINTFWDTRNNRRGTYSCPQCRQTFKTRPVLKRSTVLSHLLEEHKRATGENAAAGDDDDDGDTFAAPGDVPCDACTGRKHKASMFCLVCLASFCGTHLQPHFEVPPLKKHKLIQASARIKESICSRHDKLQEVFCRTDQQFLCLMCAVDEHKGHDTVAVSAAKCEMQRKLEKSKQDVADRVLVSQRKIADLKDAADSIRDAAWETCDDFERRSLDFIPVYIRYVKRKCSEMREKVGEAEKAGVDWTTSRLGKLQREVFELRRRENKLQQLSQTDDPIQFLLGFQALDDLPVFTDSDERFDLTEFVTAQKDKMKNMCDKESNELICNSGEIMLKKSRLHEEMPSRENFLRKYTKVKVDPCTVAACLHLSETKTEMSWSDSVQALPHADRFTHFYQALGEKGLEGKHYWEVEWDGGIIEVAVSYKGIERNGSGKQCCFGHNDLSWKLICSPSGCTFWHNNLHRSGIAPVCSRRVGVRLDYKAGNLSFYSVFPPDRLMLLHRVQTTFTEPLYPGFSVHLGAMLKICHI